MITGVVVARTDFVKENPEAVEHFLEHYEDSVEYVNGNTEEAAQLVGKYDIVPPQIAQKALPECNIVYIQWRRYERTTFRLSGGAEKSESTGSRRRSAAR